MEDAGQLLSQFLAAIDPAMHFRFDAKCLFVLVPVQQAGFAAEMSEVVMDGVIRIAKRGGRVARRFQGLWTIRTEVGSDHGLREAIGQCLIVRPVPLIFRREPGVNCMEGRMT